MVDVDVTMSEDIKFVAEDKIVEVMGEIGLHSFDDLLRRLDKKIGYYQGFIVGKEFIRF